MMLNLASETVISVTVILKIAPCCSQVTFQEKGSDKELSTHYFENCSMLLTSHFPGERK